MISVSEARQLILQNNTQVKPALVTLPEANGSILADDVSSKIDTPPFDQSAMDGYAFSFENWDKKTELMISGEVQAGSRFNKILNSSAAIRIFTGAPLPTGTDTVVMQENVVLKNTTIAIQDKELIKGKNVRLQGSQTLKGTVAMQAGQLITPAAISYLASLGVEQVNVYTTPSIGIIATGNELVPVGEQLSESKIFESNSAGLVAALKQIKITASAVELVKDDLTLIKKTITKQLSNDIIIITGGISEGDHDQVAKALEECGVQKIFHKVKQKPGKPFYFGMYNSSMIFALPGNPAAVLTCFYAFIVPAISHFTKQEYFKKVKMPLAAAYKKRPGFTYFLKGKTGENMVVVLDSQESYKMNSFAMADCLIELEEEKEFFEKGTMVTVMMIL